MISEQKKTMRKGGPEKCPGGPCSECIGGPHHFSDAMTEDEVTMPGHEAIARGVEVWYQCAHCSAWLEYDLDDPPSDTAEPVALMSAARLDEAFKRIEACASFVEVSEELALVRAHLDALTISLGDLDARGFAAGVDCASETTRHLLDARDLAQRTAEDAHREIARLTAALSDAERLMGAAIDNGAADRARALTAEAALDAAQRECIEATERADIAEATVGNLRAELAEALATLEARGKHLDNALATITTASAAARIEGARVEREAMLPIHKAIVELEYWAKRFETEPQGVGLDAVERRLAQAREAATRAIVAENARRARGAGGAR